MMKKDKTNIEQLNTEEAAREVAVEKDHDPGDAVTAQDGEKTLKKPILKKALIVVAVLVCAAVIAGGGILLSDWIYRYLYNSTGSSTTVADNVYVNDTDIGGMAMDEAREELAEIETAMASQVKVDVKIGDKTRQLTQKEFPCSFDTDAVFEKIRKFSEEKGFDKAEQHYEIKMTTDTSGIDKIVDQIAEEVSVEPVDARVKKFSPNADEMFSYEEEKAGRALDKDDLKKKLKGVFKDGKVSGSVKATIEETYPDMTVAYLRNNIVKLSSFSTESTNNDNGNHNMKISLKACNGSIIEPGATWSFNDCTGDSNDPDNGYKPAGVIVQGRSETGVGGGICQSSTTIYNAGILCGMEIKERACHYYKSTYVDAGRDATIDYGNIDLKMKNTFDYPLFMKCWMDGTELHCEMYGLQNPKFDEIKISTSDPDYFSTGYTVKAWRTYLLNGKEVDEDELPKSTYYTVAPSSGSDNDSNSSSSDDDDDDDDSSDSSSSSSSSSDDSDSSSSDNSASSSSAANNNNNAANNEASANEGDASSEQAQE